MIRSMTGFASLSEEIDAAAGDDGVGAGIAGARASAVPLSCQWELRAVNGRGLDLRFRLPDWLQALEPVLRKRLAAVVARGNVTLSLRIARGAMGAGQRLNMPALDAALTLLAQAQDRAQARGLTLAPLTAADLLHLRGVLDSGDDLLDPAPLLPVLMARAEGLIADFDATRRAEGAALRAVLDAQVDRIAALLGDARALMPARAADQARALRAALDRLAEAAGGEGGAPQPPDAGRIEQELALLALRGDVTEELDRLAAHIDTARGLLGGDDGPVGRKLDFLMQEFNREANTLCSKSQHEGLTRIGLDLKLVIDQMREQVQNVE